MDPGFFCLWEGGGALEKSEKITAAPKIDECFYIDNHVLRTLEIKSWKDRNRLVLELRLSNCSDIWHFWHVCIVYRLLYSIHSVGWMVCRPEISVTLGLNIQGPVSFSKIVHILVSLGLDHQKFLGLETETDFLRVSVSKAETDFQKSRFRDLRLSFIDISIKHNTILT